MQKSKKFYILLAIIVVILIPAGYFGWKLFYPPAFFPHEHIVIGLPFQLSDIPSSMIPMGETIYHPKPKVPNGHPGIDFRWDEGESHDMLAAASGTIVSYKVGASEPGKIDIEIASGNYFLRYKEMDDTNNLQVGAKVQKGDIVGHAGHYCDNNGQNGAEHCWFSVHWELASRSNVLDRYCPVTYFDAQSRIVMETLWRNVPETDKIKSQFPDICSGDYKDKVEK